MKIWGITDVGLVRKENQDAYAVESRDGFDICAVCDGMGGGLWYDRPRFRTSAGLPCRRYWPSEPMS